MKNSGNDIQKALLGLAMLFNPVIRIFSKVVHSAVHGRTPEPPKLDRRFMAILGPDARIVGKVHVEDGSLVFKVEADGKKYTCRQDRDGTTRVYHDGKIYGDVIVDSEGIHVIRGDDIEHYDENGILRTKEKPDGSVEYYNEFGELERVEKRNGDVDHYLGGGNLVWRTSVFTEMEPLPTREKRVRLQRITTVRRERSAKKLFGVRPPKINPKKITVPVVEDEDIGVDTSETSEVATPPPAEAAVPQPAVDKPDLLTPPSETPAPLPVVSFASTGGVSLSTQGTVTVGSSNKSTVGSSVTEGAYREEGYADIAESSARMCAHVIHVPTTDVNDVPEIDTHREPARHTPGSSQQTVDVENGSPTLMPSSSEVASTPRVAKNDQPSIPHVDVAAVFDEVVAEVRPFVRREEPRSPRAALGVPLAGHQERVPDGTPDPTIPILFPAIPVAPPVLSTHDSAEGVKEQRLVADAADPQESHREGDDDSSGNRDRGREQKDDESDDDSAPA